MKTQLLLIASLLSTLCMAESSNSLEKRIDFGDSLIMGQSNDSGAIYLSHRKQNDITSLLSIRLHYRDEILEGFHFYQIDATTGLPIEQAQFIEGLQTVSDDTTEGNPQ